MTIAADIACAHCGLPVPAALVDQQSREQFCCAGCRTVYSVIHSCRLDRYYDFLRSDLQAGGQAVPAKVAGRAYAEFDTASFMDLHAPQRSDGTRCAEFFLEGVHCVGCAWLVEKLPSICPCVIDSRLDFGKRLLRIRWVDGGATRLSAIARLLDSLGYAPHPVRSSSARAVRTADERREVMRLGVAGACAGNTMLLAAALYAGLFSKMDPAFLLLFRWISMALGILSLAWPGKVFFRGAWAALRTRTPHLDLPISLALAAGGLVGMFNTLRNSGEVYFDSLTVLVFLLLAGRYLQRRQQGAAEDAMEMQFSLAPATAHRVMPTHVEDVPIGSLAAGETLEVLPGEAFPVDGRLLPGHQTTVDESLLTGESRAQRKSPTEMVLAGTTNLSSPVRVQALAAGDATRAGKLMQLVRQCAGRRAPLVLFADRLAGWFFVSVLLIAAAVCAGWWIGGAGPAAVNYAVAVLIVACPCALGLATPLAVAVTIGRAARKGILIKGGESLERLARPGTLFLDKTGTLTAGRLKVCLWRGDDEVRHAVAAIERHATHPVAVALSDWPTPFSAEHVRQDTGGGITGMVKGRHYWIGTDAYALQGPPTGPWEAAVRECFTKGYTPIIVTRLHNDRREVVAIAGVGDFLRSDAKGTLSLLKSRGWRLAILSGDHPEIVRRVAGELNIQEFHARLLPEEKLAIIQKAMAEHPKKDGPIVMIGDGVNDAAALAAAAVGIAVHGGAEASLSAASICLHQTGLSGVAEVIHGARATLRVIHRSLAASIMYNLFTVSLAASGLISPLVAAILMPISSLTVISLALSAKTFREKGA